MAELRGKGWRVLGYFVWLLGAGIVLDSDADRFAALLVTLGGALFLYGAWQSWVVPETEREQPCEEPDAPNRS